MLRAYDQVKTQQRSWADKKGIKCDSADYTLELNDNLYIPLSTSSRIEFASGQGDELGSEGIRGKMQALHSSSALVANVFEYWRDRNINAIAEACGSSQEFTELHFEKTHPTPLGGIPPHLDLEFSGKGVSALSIESKFRECYQRHTKRTIKPRYLNQGLWDQLPKCRKLVEQIHDEEAGKTSFTFLDVPQLLKHILGLSSDHNIRGFELLYLWYDVESPEAVQHRQEIEEFIRNIDESVRFRSMTYQSLFQRIYNIPGVENKYIDYLKERYFPE